MPRTTDSVLIVDDEKLAADTLTDWLRSRSDRLSEDADIQWYDRLDVLHSQLLDDFAPTWAFVDIQLRTDRTGGLRALELLHGLSPTTKAVVISVEGRVLELREKLVRWPFVRGTVTKGRIEEQLPPILNAAEAAETTGTAETEKPEVLYSAAVEAAARSIGLDLTKLVRAAFPLDERVRVVTATSGRSPAVGFGVVVLSSRYWRSQNAFYFLKAATGEHGERLLRKEFDNYRLLRRELINHPNRLVPDCYGLVTSDDAQGLLFQYVGVVEERSIVPEHWAPTHLDGFVLGWKGDVNHNHRDALGAAYSPLGTLLRLRSAGGRWPGDERQQSVDSLCREAAARIERRLADDPPTNGEGGSRSWPLNEPRLELEECTLVGRRSIPNPVHHLHGLEVEVSQRLLSLGLTHGDLHCKNLVRSAAGGSTWMLIDFGHSEVQNLQLLDAARLECDLLLEKLPLLPLPDMFKLAESLLWDLREEVGAEDQRPPSRLRHGDQRRVERFRVAVEHLRLAMSRDWRERVRAASGDDPAPAGEISFKRQYLYALLYESVRWLTHEAGPLRFLHRLFYGAVVCETLMPELIDRPVPAGQSEWDDRRLGVRA